MAVIWGLDLKEMQWGKFKNSYMWSDAYHLRRTKFAVYQLAMILCVVSESLGTDALSKYNSEQKQVIKESLAAGRPANVYNNDIVGSFSYNIFVGVYVATIFGSAFFFDLFWPERREIRGVRLAWRICSVLACVFALSSALVLTVVLATHEAYVEGPFPDAATLSPPLVYHSNGEAIASVVLIWLGWLATCWSCVIMWKSLAHNKIHGPVAAHLRDSEHYEKSSILCHGDPFSPSNGAGAAGTSALDWDSKTKTSNATLSGEELREKVQEPLGVPMPQSVTSVRATADAGTAPHTVQTSVFGPYTTTSGPSTTTTQTTTATVSSSNGPRGADAV